MEREDWQQQSFLEKPQATAQPPRERAQKSDRRLREAIEPYIDVANLRRLASERQQLEEALRTGDIPDEVSWLLSLLAAMISPVERDQVKSPTDIAAHLQLKLGHLCQEQFCVVCLNAKNRVQKAHTLYQGTVDTANIRIAEVFREPVKLNSAAIITAHNHPSGDPSPSTEDIQIVEKITKAGKLLEIDHHDHIKDYHDLFTERWPRTQAKPKVV